MKDSQDMFYRGHLNDSDLHHGVRTNSENCVSRKVFAEI